MEVWMKIWMFLDENDDVDSLSDIAKRSGFSYPSVLDGVRIMEDVGYINITSQGRKKIVVKTQKFADTRKNMCRLIDAIEKND